MDLKNYGQIIMKAIIEITDMCTLRSTSCWTFSFQSVWPSSELSHHVLSMQQPLLSMYEVANAFHWVLFDWNGSPATFNTKIIKNGQHHDRHHAENIKFSQILQHFRTLLSFLS